MDDMIFRSFPMKQTQIPWLHWLPDLKTDRAEELSWLRCLTQNCAAPGFWFHSTDWFKGTSPETMFFAIKLAGGSCFFSLKPKINDSCWKKHTISDQPEMATSVLDVLPSLNGLVVFPTKLRNSHRTREWNGRWSNWCNFCPESNFKHLQNIAFLHIRWYHSWSLYLKNMGGV